MVTGCMADVFPEKIKALSRDAIIIGTGKESQLEEIRKAVLILLESTGELATMPVDGSSKRSDPFSPTFILPISEGCLGSCSYCITRFARGGLSSYAPDELLARFRQAVREGAREIFLTSQDTGIYGRDSEHSLPKLLDRLLAVEGRYFIRIGMMNPDSLEQIFSPFFTAFAHPAVYKFLHVPVQSGSDRVLEGMNRGYTSGEYLSLIARAREQEDFTLSTDIIVGFPGETEEDFQESVSLIRELRPDVLNITRFSERPGTAASRLQGKVHGRISKERSRVLTALASKIQLENNQSFVGDRFELLMTKRGHHGASLGRSARYKAVAVYEELELGAFYEVEVQEAHEHYLVGERV